VAPFDLGEAFLFLRSFEGDSGFELFVKPLSVPFFHGRPPHRGRLPMQVRFGTLGRARVWDPKCQASA